MDGEAQKRHQRLCNHASAALRVNKQNLARWQLDVPAARALGPKRVVAVFIGDAARILRIMRANLDIEILALQLADSGRGSKSLKSDGVGVHGAVMQGVCVFKLARMTA